MDEQDGPRPRVPSGPHAPAGLRSSPSGRVPQWVLDEAAGRPVDPGPWRDWSPAANAPPRRRRGWARVRGLLTVLLVVGLSLGAAHLAGPPVGPTAAEPAPAQTRPTPGVDSADAPLGTPLPAPPGGGVHGFVDLQADGTTPVGYDPCRPVHYVVRPDNAPAGGEQVLQGAVARVAEVTGLVFVYDGPTDEASGASRALYQPDRYGDRWAPVLVSWQTEQENPDFLTDVAGEAGSASVSVPGGPSVLVSGVVDLDAAAFARILGEPGGAAVARAIVLHELGHLVGLDHVTDPGQLMYPEASDVLDFAAGDLTGLAALGAGVCVPEV